MNVIEPTEPVKIKAVDKSTAEISFCLFPQNPNEQGFIKRFLTEKVAIEPVSQDGDGKVIPQNGERIGARFKVLVQKVEPEKKTTPKKKPVTDG